MLTLFQIYGERKENSIYSLWESKLSANPFIRDNLLFKSNSFGEIKEYYEENYNKLNTLDLYIHIGLTEEEINDYLNPTQEEIEDMEFDYKCYAD